LPPSLAILQHIIIPYLAADFTQIVPPLAPYCCSSPASIAC
jgi:hypothetical protein